MTLSLRRIISAELLRLGASSVRITENGGARHTRVIAMFNGRTLEMSAPRGNVPRGTGSLKIVPK